MQLTTLLLTVKVTVMHTYYEPCIVVLIFLNFLQEVVVDESLKVVSTPAFMCNAPVHLVYEGIGNLVNAIIAMSASK